MHVELRLEKAAYEAPETACQDCRKDNDDKVDGSGNTGGKHVGKQTACDAADKHLSRSADVEETCLICE